MWLFASFFAAIGILATTINVTEAKFDYHCNLTAKGNPKFPDNFSFGVSTSAYQIEGAWNEDGRGESIWDEFTHKFPDMMDDRSNADVAADSYHRFDQDLAALKELKVNHYRFSIAWPRIYPTGDISSKNQKGIDYYNKVIDKLIANGITPIVTLFHYDLPSEIQKFGGFANPLIINMFVTYAIECFENFGDRVKIWNTFNEPIDYCKPGYADANYPPQINAHGVADYLCMDHTLKAHAAAYRTYRSRFYEKQRGKIGMALNSRFFYSHTNDQEAISRGMQFNLGFLSHPIFSKTGGYPPAMVETIHSNSLKEGRISSRLPRLDGKWKEIIKGSADFLGLNYYTSRYIKRASEPMGENPSWDRDYDCDAYPDETWVRGKPFWLYCVPEGLEDILKYIRDQYGNPEVIITENGWSDDGDLEDDDRIHFIKSHMQAALNAVNDGCNVTGYTVWSLIDNFEWQRGYTNKFGLYAVNLNSPNKERTPRKSAKYYRKVIETKTLPSI
ncbi:myrosinase 1-like [Episyrphus balteatus]|uniref:myrosinase 1-like n=1 Tax=Episyrphus balteatus TaxID=286459 RepID=UPI0024852F08|nr:myrosinase 1-like [Episyrphus balteatus]